MEKILTIVIPTYNMQDYLRRCLDSLIVPEEQMQLLEVLVVNDGSKDNSSAIAHEYQDKYPGTFRVIDKENGNYGSCVNRGLKETTGKYIKILDADDWFDTDNFELFIKKLYEIDVDVVITNYTSYFPGETKDTAFSFNKGLFSFEEAFCDKRYELESVQMHAICYKTSCFHGLNYHQTEGISYTDQEWILLPWINVSKLFYLPLSVYQYNLSREGQTCDMKVYFDKMPDQFLGIKNSIAAFSRLSLSDDNLHKKIVFSKIKSRIENLYRCILLYKRENPDFLINFDKELSNNNVMFSVLNTVKLHPYFPYCYISSWRNNGYKKMPFVVFATNLFLENAVSFFKYIAKKINN